MEQDEPEIERFDTLFARIDTITGPEDDVIPHRESATQRLPHRSTPKVGKLFFTLFSSETKSGITEEPLYSPAITAFGIPKVRMIHIKRHELESGEHIEANKKKAIKKLNKLEKLFNQYVSITTD
jgi:hypothetical protein